MEKKAAWLGVELVKVNVRMNGEAESNFMIQSTPTFKVLGTLGHELMSIAEGSEADVDMLLSFTRSHKLSSIQSFILCINFTTICAFSLLELV